MKTTYFDGAKSVQLDMLQQWSDLGNMPWADSSQNARRTAATVAFLYRCIDLRANAVASMPWGLFRGQEEIVSDDVDEMPAGLEYLESLQPMLQRVEQALTLGSRAYLLKQANRVRVRGLQWLDPATMEPEWTASGLVSFKRTFASGRVTRLSSDEVIYIWYHGTSETEPHSSPALAALNAANVLASVDLFAKGFFDRGAIKGTLLQAEGNPPQAEKERLKAWWKRMFGGGTRTAWEAEVVSASVTPIVIGEGISELSNANLAMEKREDIATAMGVPHSLVLSNASNFAVSESDRLNFYDTTIVPECKLIQRQLNEQLFAPLGLRFEFKPELLPVYQTDEGQRATSFATYVNAGIRPSVAAQMVGLDLPEGIDFDDLDPDPEEQRQMMEAMQGGASEDDDEERKEEEQRFKRWAKKRKGACAADFKSALLSEADKEALLDEMSAAPFVFPTGQLTRDAYKALRLQLDPDDDEAEQQLMRAVSDSVQDTLEKSLREWLREVFPNDSEASIADWERRLIAGQARFRDVLTRALQQGADLGVNVAFDQMERIGMAFDYTLVHADARDWARRYVGELITGIENTTRHAVQAAVAQWVESGQPLNALIRDLAPTFGRQRAKLIAATEVTRAYAEGTEIAYRASGVVSEYEVRTAADERVCPICSKHTGKRYRLGSGTKPPFHPGCRCFIAPVVGD